MSAAGRAAARLDRMARRYGQEVEVGGARFWAFLLPLGLSAAPGENLGPTGTLAEASLCYWGPAQNGGELLAERGTLQAKGQVYLAVGLRDHPLGQYVVARSARLIPLGAQEKEEET